MGDPVLDAAAGDRRAGSRRTGGNRTSTRHGGACCLVAVGWQSLGNTIFGYGLRAWLLSRHSAATVTPLALLVPVFGLGTAAVFLGEPQSPVVLAAAALILAGLVVNIVARRRNEAVERDIAPSEPV